MDERWRKVANKELQILSPTCGGSLLSCAKKKIKTDEAIYIYIYIWHFLVCLGNGRATATAQKKVATETVRLFTAVPHLGAHGAAAAGKWSEPGLTKHEKKIIQAAATT